MWNEVLATLFAGTGTFIAAAAIIQARRERARELATGMHASMHMEPWVLPRDVKPLDEPGRWDTEDLVLLLRNSSPHPYYSVIASVRMQSREEVWAARLSVSPPETSLAVKVGEIDGGAGCDIVPMDEATQVRITFRDSAGVAWERASDGRLTRGFHADRR